METGCQLTHKIHEELSSLAQNPSSNPKISRSLGFNCFRFRGKTRKPLEPACHKQLCSKASNSTPSPSPQIPQHQELHNHPASKILACQLAICEDILLYCCWLAVSRKGLERRKPYGYTRGLEAGIKSAALAADLITTSKSLQE